MSPDLPDSKGIWPPLSNLSWNFPGFGRSAKLDNPGQRPEEAVNVVTKGLKVHGPRWIGNCVENHEACRQNKTDQAWSPDRLIEVRAKTETEVYQLRLIKATVEALSRYYTTLSHRWSTEDFLKLTRDNLQRLSHGFSSSELSQTFGDAVSATYHLGFRHF